MIADTVRIVPFPLHAAAKRRLEVRVRGMENQTNGAAFLQNLSTGTIVIARRGIFTDGPPRIAEPDPGSTDGTLGVEIVRVNP